MKRICTFLCLLVSSHSSYSQFNTSGLKVPTKDMLEKIPVVRPRPAGVTSLKPAVNLSRLLFLPSPGMQGFTQGSCTAWSVAYGMMTYLKAKQVNWSVFNNQSVDVGKVFSPSFLYNSLNTDQSCRSGIFLTDALDFSRDLGAVPLSSFKYNPDQCTNRPNSELMNLAHNTRLLSYNKIFDFFTTAGTIDIVSVKVQLNDSLVVPIGVHLDNSFINDTYGDRSHNASRPFIWDRFNNDVSLETAYHAMLCVGYDDNLQAFIVMNSWDTNFGNGGLVYISYNVFRQVVKEAYVGTLRPKYASAATPNHFLNTSLNTGHNLFNNFIADTNWIKVGYYRQYGELRIGCLGIKKTNNSAIVRLTNMTDSVVIAAVELKVGDDFQEYEYQGREIQIKLNKIGHAGRNPFTKAIFYEINYKNVAGKNFDEK